MLKSPTHEVEAGPVKATLLAAGDTIVAQLRAGKGFEPQSLARWAELCAEGGTVLDIGAYSGLFSIIAAKLGCQVIAFEPMSLHAKRCRDNFDLNGVKADLRHCCVSDRIGKAEVQYNPNVPGMTSGASLIRPSGMRKGDRINIARSWSVTIDSLDLTECTAMKIDVERGEPAVLRGARETLERCRPMLLVEVLGPDENYAVKKVLNGSYREAERLDVRNVVFEPT